MENNKYPARPILLVDDEAHTLASFDIALRSSGLNNTIRCQDSREVITILQKQDIDLLLLDLMMPHVSGQEILAQVKQDFPDIPVIIVSGVNELDTAVQCMREGAFDFVSKPVDVERLLPSIRRAMEVRHLRDENIRLSKNLLGDTLENPDAFSRIITQSPKMRAVFQYCEAIAAGQTPILITGETGVGKELISQVLHKLSGRQNDLVAVNVAGVDDHIFSDTLFGHIKGAFTGADRTRQGLVEKAANGTLFLDEVGDLGGASQVKLLRFLEEREFYPLGSDVAKTSNARIIVATQADLEEHCESGNFRKDLYYRLKTHHVQIPPLRERCEDISLLLDYFLEMAAQEYGKEKPTYHKELLTHLQAYHFPGNIRELKSMVYDAVSTHTSKMLSAESFKANIVKKPASTVKDTLGGNGERALWAQQFERLPSLKEATQVIMDEAMRRTNNNQRAAALLLGITPQALNQRLKRK